MQTPGHGAAAAGIRAFKLPCSVPGAAIVQAPTDAEPDHAAGDSHAVHRHEIGHTGSSDHSQVLISCPWASWQGVSEIPQSGDKYALTVCSG